MKNRFFKNPYAVKYDSSSILFCVFLKIIFFTKKVQNRPRFSAPVHPIELKLFFTDARDTLGCLFFFVLKNIVLSIFGRYYKKSCSWKTCTFNGVLGILTFFLERNEIERKKNRHSKVFLVPVKKSFSSIGHTAAEKGGPFLTIETPGSLWRKHFRILSLWQLLFYSSRSIYPESFRIQGQNIYQRIDHMREHIFCVTEFIFK